MVNKNDSIYKALKRDICYLKLKPGNLISENEISQQFGVSRSPIRQVFMKLSEEGLVEIIPQKGTFVSLIDLKYVKDTIFLRFILEKEIITKFIEINTVENINFLKYNLTKQENALKFIHEDDMLIEFNKLDNEFHRTIFEVTDHINIWNIIDKLASHYLRFRILDIFNKNNMKELYKHHTLILKYIEEKNFEQLYDVLDRHLKGGYERLVNIQNEYTEYFVKK
ncbi:MAG: hypothetical protein K0Q49_2143 [Haloplasmataceae bacterium]|jgi:DNA-binding GntR family transcriptional regulator|nr:hypothetical protein [Haloplasmataceae bacterium]